MSISAAFPVDPKLDGSLLFGDRDSEDPPVGGPGATASNYLPLAPHTLAFPLGCKDTCLKCTRQDKMGFFDTKHYHCDDPGCDYKKGGSNGFRVATGLRTHMIAKHGYIAAQFENDWKTKK